MVGRGREGKGSKGNVQKLFADVSKNQTDPAYRTPLRLIETQLLLNALHLVLESCAVSLSRQHSCIFFAGQDEAVQLMPPSLPQLPKLRRRRALDRARWDERSADQNTGSGEKETWESDQADKSTVGYRLDRSCQVLRQGSRTARSPP